jgi:hypothetical protein
MQPFTELHLVNSLLGANVSVNSGVDVIHHYAACKGIVLEVVSIPLQ